jgi:hypothetical protein
MRQVRMSVFETNSSSTHSLTIVTAEEYAKFKAGTLAYNRGSKELVELTKPATVVEDADADDDDDDDDEVQSYKQYNNGDDCLETFEQSFTTPSGDKMVAFGKYGNDW